MNLNTSEWDVLTHSLGVSIYQAQHSRRKIDKMLPPTFYRNRFCAGPDHSDFPAIVRLVELGLMVRTNYQVEGSFFWVVTEAGQALLRQEWSRLIQKPKATTEP